MTLAVDLTGRVALVTGGTRGIGLGITRSLQAAGATVVTCSRSEAEPAPGTTHHVCDVRDPDAVGALVERIVADHGRLDVLVNNAGGGPPAAGASARRRRGGRARPPPTRRPRPRASTTRSSGSTSSPRCSARRPRTR